ncbi:MAG: hypothetical protein J3Q66DRAFT_96475 [Benniella sp.]|nr:MAG: hypothetical protein J3Q66DRAFT_147321 [Benniella sp.]KAK3824812.1 MAG: hypothetical protein J3Q66DRAFT_96475 [Benniella sp.]
MLVYKGLEYWARLRLSSTPSNVCIHTRRGLARTTKGARLLCGEQGRNLVATTNELSLRVHRSSNNARRNLAASIKENFYRIVMAFTDAKGSYCSNNVCQDPVASTKGSYYRYETPLSTLHNILTTLIELASNNQRDSSRVLVTMSVRILWHQPRGATTDTKPTRNIFIHARRGFVKPTKGLHWRSDNNALENLVASTKGSYYRGATTDSQMMPKQQYEEISWRQPKKKKTPQQERISSFHVLRDFC